MYAASVDEGRAQALKRPSGAALPKHKPSPEHDSACSLVPACPEECPRGREAGTCPLVHRGLSAAAKGGDGPLVSHGGADHPESAVPGGRGQAQPQG